MNRTTIEWTNWSVNALKLQLPNGALIAASPAAELFEPGIRNLQVGPLINACVHKSRGCEHCYAETLTRRWWKKEWGEFPGYVPALLKMGKPVLVEKELEAVLRLSQRIAAGKADPNENRIFWHDMTDEYLDFWPDELLDRVWAVRALTPNLIHQVLTKRAERMCRYLSKELIEDDWMDAQLCLTTTRAQWEFARAQGGLPPRAVLSHVHLGVSVEDQKTADERIPWLLKTSAAVRFVSAEPLLGPINLSRYLKGDITNDKGRSSVSCIAGYRSVLDRRTGENLATPETYSRQQDRRASVLARTAESEAGGDEQFGREEGELDGIPSGDVHNGRGEAMERGGSPGCLDGAQPAGYSTGAGAEPQERQRTGQSSRQPRIADTLTKHAARNSRTRQDSPTSEDERRQADSGAGTRGAKAMRSTGDDEGRDSNDVRTYGELSLQHSGPQNVEVYPGIVWLICGGESGPGARPFDIQWARDVIAQCKAAGVKVFCKQLGSLPVIHPFTDSWDIASPRFGEKIAEGTIVRLKDKKGGDPSEWPDDLKVREYPLGALQAKGE